MYRKVNGVFHSCVESVDKKSVSLHHLQNLMFLQYFCVNCHLGCLYKPPPSWLNFEMKNHLSRVLLTWFPPWWWQGIAWNLFPAVVPMVSRQNPFSILRTYSYMKTIAKSSMSKGYFIKFHHFTVELQACVW